MNKEVTISFKNHNRFRIVPDSITTGKVIVNGIEITSVEDWEKVTKSLIKLEHNWNELKKYVEDRIDTWDTAEIMLSKMQELEGVSNE